MPVLRATLVAAALACALAPAGARAGNVGLPRTPVIHQGEACITRVDRSVDPVVHLEYTIPLNDLCVTEDELPDSRTHQFIAFCRDEPPAYAIPQWLTWSEVQLTVDAGLAPADYFAQKDVLEGNTRHEGCWRRIVADDERRPISCAAARPGVDWDTTGLPPGPHVVAGYTYEPPLNQWTVRRGVFKVFDADPDAAPPAAAILDGETFLWKNQPARLSACVDAAPGATLTASWAVSTPEPEWVPFLVDEPVQSGDLELEFLPPPEQAGERLAVRIEVTDPMKRTAVAHMPGEVIIQTIEDPSGGTGDPGDTGDPDPFDFCADSPQADDPPPCAGDEPPPAPPENCACTSGHAPSASVFLLALLALPRRRR